MTVDEPQKQPELEGFQKNMKIYNAKRKFKAGVMALAAISAMQRGAAATKAANKLKERVSKGDVEEVVQGEVVQDEAAPAPAAAEG